MLAGYFDQIAEEVAGTDGAIAHIESGLGFADALTRLPLINKPIGQISQLRDSFESFRGDLYTKLNSLDPANGQAAVRTAIFNALGPAGLGILENKANPSADPTENDVIISLDSTSVDVSIDIGVTSDPFSSQVGLGIDSIPLKPNANSSGSFSVGLTYHDFHFGYNTTKGAYFRTDTSNNELQFTVNGSLPQSFDAGLGFLNVSVTRSVGKTSPDLSLTLSSDVTGGLESTDPPLSVSTPTLGGGVDLLETIEVQAGGEGMPKLKTDLRLQWTLPDVNASVPLGTGWGAPLLRFEHVQIELGALLGDVVQPIAEDVRQILKPLDPIFSVLDERIPAISDLSEDLGFGSVNLLTLSNALSELPVPPTGVIDMINQAAKLRSYAKTIKSIAELGAGGWIDVGSFTISGASGSSLLATASAKLGDLGLSNWSSLVTTDGGISFQGVKQQIVGLLGSDLGNQVNEIWEGLNSSSEDMGGITFDFPVVKDPSGVALGMLLGQDKDLVSVTGRLDLEFDKAVPIVVIPGFKIQIAGHGDVHAFAQLGYDTRGIREAITPLYTGGNFDPSKILNGLWVSGETHVDVNGSLDLQAVAGEEHFLAFTAGGGLDGSLHAGLSHPANYNPANPRLRIFAGDFSSGNLFDVNGRLDAHANLRLKAGIDTPVGFLGYDHTWNLASANLFKFDTAHIAMPGALIAPPPTPVQLYTYDLSTHTLTLKAGLNADARGVGVGVIDEKFTVTRISELIFLGGPGGPSTSYYDTFDISAFGVTQRFQGRVDRLIANMGDGDDTIKVNDEQGHTLYLLDGGNGDDTIDIDGSVKVEIAGGAGHDTIDAGNGENSGHLNYVDAGPDSDEVTFGDGVLSHMVIGAFFYITRATDDTSRDRVTIDNSRSRINTGYVFLPNFGQFDVRLDITDQGTGDPPRYVYMSQYDAITIYSGNGNDQFFGVAPTYSELNGGLGDDEFGLAIAGNPLPTGSYISQPLPTVTFNGGAGHDSVIDDDVSNTTPRAYSLSVSTDTDASTELFWRDFGSQTAFRERLIGIDDTYFTASQSSTILVHGWDTGGLALSGGEIQLGPDNTMWWNTTITIRNTPKITFFDNGDSIYTGGIIDASGPQLYLQGDHRINLDLDQVATQFSFQTDVTEVILTPELLAKNWTVSFDGGPDSTVEVITPDFNSPAPPSPGYTYRLLGDRLLINSVPFYYTSVGVWRINSGQGDDLMEIDYRAAGSSVVFDGGGGANTFVADDRLNPDRTTWVVNPDFLWNLLRYRVYLTNVAGTKVMEGSGNDIFIITNDKDLDGHEVTFEQPLEIDGGGGNDTFTIGEEGFPATFNAPVRLDGQDGDDTFNWYGVNNVYFGAVHPVSLIGGAGANSLAIDDKERSASPYYYDIYANRIKETQAGLGVWVDLQYEQMSSVSVSAGDNNDLINVWGTSINTTGGLSILGNGGNSLVLVHPHDEQGNATILGPLDCDGAGGDDGLEVDDSGRAADGDYTITNTGGTTSILGVGLKPITAHANVERVSLKTGSGNDTIDLESYLSNAIGLSIATGAGNDVLWLSRLNGNLFANIASFINLAFDGGAGDDTFFVSNVGNSLPGIYTRNGATLNVGLSGSAYSLNLSPTNFEVMTIAAGLGDDQFYLESLPAGQALNLFGNWGYDTLSIGQTGHNTQTVRGAVYFDAENGGGGLVVDDSANATGTQFHIEPPTGVTRLGGAPGDTLFGPGGSLQYSNLSERDSAGISIDLGSGVDTVFAAPQTVPLFIAGGGLSSGPADQLNLALADVVNPVQHTFSFGAGSLTSDNRGDVFWQGFEQHLTNYVFPAMFTVTNTLDSGPGSLRQAILDANASPNTSGPDFIRFAIPGFGTHTIRPLSSLPGIYDAVVLDATTQPGYAGKPVIELDGSLAANANGLELWAGDTTVRGFAINRFVGTPSAAIFVGRFGHNVIQGNYLGTAASGSVGYPLALQVSYGVVLFGSSYNTIGTDGDGQNDVFEGNVISGNNTAGVLLMNGQGEDLAESNVIAGNFIGTDVNGSTAIPNGRMGIFVLGDGVNNRFGTDFNGISDASERNLISGNAEAGIYIGYGSAIVAGNYIGTNAAGNAALPNGMGVRIENASNNRVSGNLIAYNTSHGVSIERGIHNLVSANSIHDNALAGINLWAPNDPANYVTPNDATDADIGSNNLQNFPVISTAAAVSGQVGLAGTLRSTPNTTFRVEFFASAAIDASGYGEGQNYLGYIMVTTNVNGLASYVTTLPSFVPIGQFITATATDPAGNTSEFSAGVQVADLKMLTNVKFLTVPGTNVSYVISSPVGTTLTATASTGAGVTPPSGLVFPFGFVTFTVSGLAPGAATTVIISGLDVSQIGDYYKYGGTPANGTNHWYDFLYNQATDSDSAIGTGMEIASGNIVLHLIDGSRGDDDGTANSIISDIGGAVLNHAPVATNDTATTSEDTVIKLSASTLLGNDNDVDNDALKITSVGVAVNGTVWLSGSTITFTPAADFNGIAGFDYTLSDGYLTSTGHVTITVKEVNDAPVANPDTATLNEDGTIDIAVLANDTRGPANESNQTLTIKSAWASHGTVTINSDGTLRYRPAADYFGTDTIKYTITDNGTTAGTWSPLTANGVVNVTVISVNDAPVANDQSATVTEDGKIYIKLAGSDVETPAGSLIFTITSLPSQGLLTTSNGTPVHVGDHFTGAPTLVYKPGAAREGAGSDRFKYAVTDNGGATDALSDDASVSISITRAVNCGKVTIDSAGIVRIGGTSGNDNIVATRSGNKLQVWINGKVVSSSIALSSVHEIHIWGRAGNDKINILSLDAPTLLHGGVGNDELYGGAGSSVIFGDAGNDLIVGGLANNLLVGGGGSDTLIDALGDDVLVGGNLANNLTDDVLRQMLLQWSSNRTQNGRFLQALLPDNATDRLFDSLGDDWFVIDDDDSKTDLNLFDHDLVTHI